MQFELPDDLTLTVDNPELKVLRAADKLVVDQKKVRMSNAELNRRQHDPAQAGDIYHYIVPRLAIDAYIVVLRLVLPPKDTPRALVVMSDFDFEKACDFDVEVSEVSICGSRLINMRSAFLVERDKLIPAQRVGYLEPHRTYLIQQVFAVYAQNQFALPEQRMADANLRVRLNLVMSRADRLNKYLHTT